MTVSQQIPVSNFWGNNSAREFPFNFFIEKESELLVEHTNLNGVKSILENGVDYSIHEVGNKEGSYITFPLADSRYNTLAWDTSSDKKELLTISLNLPIEQSAEFENSGDLSKKNLELSFDYAIRLIQILSRRISRAVKVKEGDEATPDQLIESLNDSKRVATEAANLATSKAEESLNNANTAKEKADIATAKTQEVTETYNNAMADIQKDWQDAIDGIAEKQTQAETSITALKTSAKLTITNGMVDITANKEQSMSAIDENRETSLAEIESAKSSAVSSVNETKNNAVTTVKQTGDEEYNKIISTGIDAKANSDLSNLTEAGEKHFLNKSQVTNCILELPQRIKYTLIDGILTILKGSVVIFPYGTEDKTADYPIGATFLNDNLKVVDTQFADGKFFVWAKLQSDTQSFSFPATGKGQIFCYFKGSEFGFTGLLLDRISSGTTAPTETNTQYWFDTNNNLVKEYGNKAFTGKICSFPLGIGTIGTNDTWTEILQVFNGVGCIGSSAWADKGVKGLIPDGRNSDETLKNIEYTSDKLVLKTFTAGGVSSEYLLLTPYDTTRPMTGASLFYYIGEDNSSIITNNLKLKGFLVAIQSRDTNGKITQFKALTPFRSANINETDGPWVCTSKNLIAYSANNFPANYRTTFDLSSYLPEPGCKYELIVDGYGDTSAAWNVVSMGLRSSCMNTLVFKSQAGSTTQTHGCGNIIVGQDRQLTVYSASSGGTNQVRVDIKAYRRVV